MNLIERYESSIAAGKITPDPSQKTIIDQLQRLLDELALQQQKWFWQRAHAIHSVYIYGPVGGGKTLLMDLFYQALPDTQKARYHFHHFMQMIDDRLRHLQGQHNPVESVAQELAKKNHVLCLDEFFVQDVSQASILASLLKTLFSRGVIFVITSNTKPDDLYLNGIHRERFLPAIDLIHRHCNLLSLNRLRDYRYDHACSPSTFITPLGKDADAALSRAFHALEPQPEPRGEIEILHRTIPYVLRGQQTIWFEFSTICSIPRCQLDYLELAQRFKVFFISNIPLLGPDDNVPVLLLMYLVDVLYDQDRRLVLSSAVEVEQLYAVGPMSTAFERTKSRLVELRSELTDF